MARIADPNRKTDILAAARAVFVEQGYKQACIADIAERAGVAPGTIYLYFGSKENIVLALAEQFYTRLVEVTLPALDNPDIAKAIQIGVHVALRFAVDEHDLLRLTRLDSGLRSLIDPLPARQAYLAALAERLSAWQESGFLQRHTPAIAADLIIGMIERAAESSLSNGNGDLKRHEAAIVDLLLSVLVPNAAEAGA